MNDLISWAAVLDAIEALQRSPWYGDEKDTAYHHRFLTRKEAVEIVRDLAVKSVPAVDAIPVEWIQAQRTEHPQTVVEFARNVAYRTVLYGWRAEQEAKDGKA